MGIGIFQKSRPGCPCGKRPSGGMGNLERDDAEDQARDQADVVERQLSVALGQTRVADAVKRTTAVLVVALAQHAQAHALHDSVGKDGTPGGFDSENLYIEGDNLEVIKLLQESYLGKVKMIYIDPPYNTGNDFIYADDFMRSQEEENAQILNAQNLKQVCLLGAYVKRRVNLALICDKKMVVPVDELAHCIRESLTYLTQYGAVCALHQEGRGSVSSREAQTAYDFFEDCLEAALPSLSALMVRLECGERFSIRLMLEDAAGLPNVDQYRTQGKLTIL